VSLFLVLLTIRPLPLQGISPSFLWAVAKASLAEKKVPAYCPRLILHNNDTLINNTTNANFEGIVPQSFISLEETLEGQGTTGGWSAWEEAEGNLREAEKRMIGGRLEPCLTLISLVLDSRIYEGALEEGRLKARLRHRLSDLLSFSTPLRTRHLLLFRLEEEPASCNKGPKYPSRLVPAWERVLFDFFPEARVVQGLFHDSDEPYLRVTREAGKWKWFCEDTRERLRAETECRLNETCLAAHPGIGEWNPRNPVPTDLANCTLGFKPRQ
jgi:hypothetical protein